MIGILETINALNICCNAIVIKHDKFELIGGQYISFSFKIKYHGIKRFHGSRAYWQNLLLVYERRSSMLQRVLIKCVSFPFY